MARKVERKGELDLLVTLIPDDSLKKIIQNRLAALREEFESSEVNI